MGDYDNLEEIPLGADPGIGRSKPSSKLIKAGRNLHLLRLNSMHKRPKWKHQLRGIRQFAKRSHHLP